MPSRSQKNNAWNYEQTIAQVEMIVEQIESGSLPLEAVFEQFSLAIEQLRQCEEFLIQRKERMELQIETLEAKPEPDVDF